MTSDLKAACINQMAIPIRPDREPPQNCVYLRGQLAIRLDDALLDPLYHGNALALLPDALRGKRIRYTGHIELGVAWHLQEVLGCARVADVVHSDVVIAGEYPGMGVLCCARRHGVPVIQQSDISR